LAELRRERFPKPTLNCRGQSCSLILADMQKALPASAFPVTHPVATLSSRTWRWLLLVVLAVVELIWVQWLGVAADLSVRGPVVIFALGLAAISVICRRRNFQVIGDVFEYSAQLLIYLVLINALSCLVIAACGDAPLADGLLARIDSAMGLNWMGWWYFLQSHQTLNGLLNWLYYQTAKEYVLVIFFLTLLQRRQESEHLLWASMLSLIIVIAISAYIPAIGATYYYGVREPSWVNDVFGLRAHTADVINSFGPVSFPSFHTVLTLLLIDAVRYNKWLLGVSLAFNGLMLLAIPTAGSHYFIDLIGGVVVTAIVLGILKNRLT
jgi:PAP2 superfamily